jgi:carbonic anhydrase
MSPTLLQELKEANDRFLSGSPRFLDPSGSPFIIITCIDPRLTGFIEPALGLPKHRVMIIRTAGNRVSETNQDVLHSVAAGIFLKGGKEIFVIGHTDCALSRFSASEVIDSFRKAGIARSAFGDEDLRTWFGAFTDIKANVLQGVEYLRRSAFVPRDMKLHGLIIGIERGELEVIHDGDVAPLESSPSTARHAEIEVSAPIVAAPAATAPSMTPSPPQTPKGATGPVVITEVTKASETRPKMRQPDSMLDAAMILRDFIARERENAQFERTLLQIDALIKNEKDPIRIVTELEKIIANYKSRYPELPGALEYLKKSVQGRGATGFGFKELMRRMME